MHRAGAERPKQGQPIRLQDKNGVTSPRTTVGAEPNCMERATGPVGCGRVLAGSGDAGHALRLRCVISTSGCWYRPAVLVQPAATSGDVVDVNATSLQLRWPARQVATRGRSARLVTPPVNVAFGPEPRVCCWRRIRIGGWLSLRIVWSLARGVCPYTTGPTAVVGLATPTGPKGPSSQNPETKHSPKLWRRVRDEAYRQVGYKGSRKAVSNL